MSLSAHVQKARDKTGGKSDHYPLPTSTSMLAAHPLASAGVRPFPLEPEESRAWKEENTVLYLISLQPSEMEGTETSAESERVTWKILMKESRHWMVERAPAIHT